ncbi:MAG: CRTAC1 family protein [Myxococcales bacterium]|nr:CRTAC1 family protein [Myxococcales bacterium]
MRRHALTLAGLLAGCGGGGVAVPGSTGGPDTSDGDGPTSGEATGSSGASDTSTATDGPGTTNGPRLMWWTPATTPGSSVFVRVNRALAAVELRVGGHLLGAPLVASEVLSGEQGGLFALPEGLGAGPTTLAVRAAGADADADTADLAIQAPTFVDVADAVGLSNLHDVSGHPQQCAWSQTGVGFADVDNDGDSDAYVGNVGGPGRLLRNEGAAPGELPAFVDVTGALGLTVDNVAAVSFADYDGDGDRDVFVGRRGPNALLQNRLIEDGALGFVDVTAAAGVAGGEQRSMGAAWGDYDGDGDLDLYVVNHALCFPVSGSVLAPEDRLYRNDGGVFVEVTQLLAPDPAIGFSAAWVDLELDGDVDLVVINDHVGGGLSGPNAVWRNDGPGDEPGAWRFTDVSVASGLAIAAGAGDEGANGMGLAIGDVNHDGYPDVAFTNIGPNFLMLSRGDGTFEDASEARQIRRGGLPWKRPSITWAVHLFDHDNDADLDLYYAGGDIHGDALIPDALLRNDGEVFREVTWGVGLVDLGHAKGSALVDLDRDGSLDLATAHWARPLRVFNNRHATVGSPGRWLVVELVGAGANRDAIGGRVAVEAPGLPVQTCFVTGSPALGAGGEPICHFGLAGAATISKLTITWPNGQVTTPPPPAVDSRVTFVQP